MFFGLKGDYASRYSLSFIFVRFRSFFCQATLKLACEATLDLEAEIWAEMFASCHGPAIHVI